MVKALKYTLVSLVLFLVLAVAVSVGLLQSFVEALQFLQTKIIIFFSPK